MALPKPKYPLQDSCSVLYNNTLYAYTSEAFQSLSLEQGAKWTQLSMGTSVSGGVCVKATPAKGKAALYIVGGTTNNTGDYQGLQKYTFDDGKWQVITPTALVAQNRLWHSAVYLNGSDAILMYAGSQDGSKFPSSQTFTIQASEPYDVTSYQSIAPPAIQPLLIPWTADSAIYIGGSDINTQVMEFSTSTSWRSTDSSLATPLYNSSAIKAVVVDGDDGSKSLYTFDMTVSPNQVNRTVLINGAGLPVQNAEAIISTREAAKRAELTVSDWPSYNGTLAPKSTRSSYSVAMGGLGQVVISGGNENDPLCIFQAKENTWMNATAMLVKSSSQQIIVPSITPTGTTETSATSSAASATSATSTASSGKVSSKFPVKVLGAVLGSIIGLALLLIGGLILFRWQRKRKQLSEARRQGNATGFPVEKDGFEFADRGLPELHSARQMPPRHGPSDSQGSFSSMAILMGRIGHRRGDDEKGNGSAGTDTSIHFNKNYKPAISNPMPQAQENSYAQQAMAKEVSFGQDTVTPRPRTSGRARRGSTRRSSGWNRYWSGGSAMTNFLGLGSKRNTIGSDSSSHYSDPRLPTASNAQRLPSQITTTSALVPPLQLPSDGGLYRVASASPTVGTASSLFTSREMSAQIERPDSYVSNASSYDDRRDAFSSGVPESVHDRDPESWAVPKNDWSYNRPSNTYTASIYTTANRDTTTNNFLFPEPQPQRPPQRQHQPTPSSDMSWLNLGTDTRI
ncbi:hypothetical protein ACMFMG_000800 [Clarireedia jacksonii]